jgi:PST family polysaccharide transporter
VSLALARLLTPANFGLVAMIAVLTGFLAVFGEMGFAEALVQRPEIEERHRSSVFWLNVLTGIALAAGLAAAAPFIARFYGDDRLVWLVRVLAIDFALAPLQMVQRANLLRELQFRALALAESVGVLVSSAVAIGLAIAGYGVWALVGKAIGSTLGVIVALWSLSGWRPRFSLERAALGELWGFSSHLLGFSTVAYWARQVDDLLIGRMLGAAPLGLYGRAYSTMMMPVNEVGGVLTRVMFPTFSKLQHDPRETKGLYLRVVAVLAFVTFPVMLGLAAIADVFIRVLYGAQWSGATNVLRIYCVVGCSLAIGSTTTWIFKSQGRTDLMFRWGLVAAAVTIGGIVVGVSFGSIESVAIGYGVTHVAVLAYHRYSIPGRLIGLSPGEVLRAVWGSLSCAVVMAAAVFGVGLVLSERLPAGLDLALRTAFGALLYLVLARSLRVRGFTESLELVRGRLLHEESAP